MDCDHYWPDVEFYLDDVRVRYVLHLGPRQRERSSDPGLAPERFVDPKDWRSGSAPGEHWLVHYRGQSDSPFDAVSATPAATVGEFDLYRLDTRTSDTALR